MDHHAANRKNARMTDLVPPEALAYADAHTTAPAGSLGEVAAWTAANTAAPQMMSGVPEARLLEALIVAGGARRVLEIGTFTGFGTLTMAAALPDGGRITTLEIDEATAASARRHIEASPYADRIELLIGDARETIAGLDGPFDLVYIDAWKAQYPDYYEAVVPKLVRARRHRRRQPVPRRRNARSRRRRPEHRRHPRVRPPGAR